MKNDQYSFYTYDPIKGQYDRLAVIKSLGLAHLMGEKLLELYPKSLFMFDGVGKLTIHYLDVAVSQLKRV